MGVVLNLRRTESLCSSHFSAFFLYLIALSGGYYCCRSAWGIVLNTHTHTTHTLSSPFGFICMAFHLDFASIDGFGGRIKKTHLCVAAFFPLGLQSAVKDGAAAAAAAAGAHECVHRCHERTRPSGPATIAAGVNYSLHHHIYPARGKQRLKVAGEPT